MTGQGHIGAFLRFVAVGGSFSVIFAVTTAALIGFAGTAPLPTSVVVYLCCIPPAFLAQRRIAFRASSSGRNAVFIYAATQLISLAFVATITSRFATAQFWLDTLLYLVTAGLAAVMSYLICRFIIFRSSEG